MDTNTLIAHIDRLLSVAKDVDHGVPAVSGYKAEVCEFLRNFAGPKSSFFSSAEVVDTYPPDEGLSAISELLIAYRRYLEAGLRAEVTPERRAQLDVVSDLLGQADRLLADSKTHPAAPAVLIGATLEEFLRTWVESSAFSIGNSKPGLDAFARVLREADKINKQDIKDITSWAGTRNDAAHGKWLLVDDRARIRLMLEGVNLFLRKYGA